MLKEVGNKTGEAHQRLNPPKSLTRPQFIDCLIRLSMLKFRALGDANSGAIQNREQQRSPADAVEIIARRIYALFQAFSGADSLHDWKRPPNAPCVDRVRCRCLSLVATASA